MTKLSEIIYRNNRTPWSVYVRALAEIIDEPAAIVYSYLDANPWNLIGQRCCETYNVHPAYDGGYPCMVDRDFVEKTSVAELRDLASSVHVWEMRLRHLYVIARNAGVYQD